MRVFVTGGTGTIGAAVVRELVAGGHTVSVLARSAIAEEQTRALGAAPLRGDLAQPSEWQEAAAGHDALIHAGFGADADAVAVDRAAAAALVDAARLAGRPCAVVYTSGVLVLGTTGNREADEDASAGSPAPAVAWRPSHERMVLAATNQAIATAVIRPGFVYGGRKGIVEGYFDTARRDGVTTYVGDGTNRLALVHRDDLARLYRQVVERRVRGIFHGVDGASPRVVDIARAASEAAGARGEISSIPIAAARRELGPFADALCVDQVVVAPRSAEIGWTPSRPAFTEDARRVFAEWGGR